MSNGNLGFESISHRKHVLSKHASKRASQRGISPMGVRLVKAFGEKEFDGRGGIRYLMTSSAISDLRRVVGSTQQVDALAGVYAVVSATDETVITVGHRYA
jgi:hypothetical protein